MRDLLRPKPFRGDQVAAGTVLLTILVALLNERFADRWADGVNLAYTAGATVLVATMAVLSRTGEPAKAYQSALQLCAIVLLALTFADLAIVLPHTISAATTIAWVSLGVSVAAFGFSRLLGSAGATLIGCLTGSVAVYAGVQEAWGLDPARIRWVTLALVAVLLLATLWQRVREPVHGVQLANAAGLVTLVIPLSHLVNSVLGIFSFDSSGEIDGRGRLHGLGAGWEGMLLLGGIALIATGAADRERGNVIIGIANLVAFALLATQGNLVGWPALLAIAAGTLLMIGLRPSTPLPPEPDPPDGGGPLVELRPI